LRAFAGERVDVHPDASVAGSQAKVEVIMNDGARYAARCDHPLGSFENPLSRAQIEQKFRTYAAGVLAESHIENVIEAVARLETRFGAKTDGPDARAAAGPCHGGGGVIDIGQRQRSAF
jgi:2-methylcitrate dehydratase PrpD